MARGGALWRAISVRRRAQPRPAAARAYPTVIHILPLAFALLAPGAASAATCTWLGGSGNWGTASAWSCGAIPGSGDAVVISPTGSTVAITSTQSVGALSLSTGNVLNLSNAYLFPNGNETIDGTLNIANGSRVSSSVASVVYSGTGAIVLDSSVNYAQIYGAGGTVAFGAGLTVRGQGQIGLNSTYVINNGVISADAGTATSLDIDPTGGNAGAGGAGVGTGGNAALYNTGILQATNASTLDLDGGLYENSATGVIKAINGGTVSLNNDSRIIGGTLSSDATSAISASGTSQYLQGVTLTAGSRLELTNDYLFVNTAGLVDNGTITIANGSRLNNESATPVTYNGSGTIVLDNSANYAQLYGNGGTVTFGANLTVRGSGQIGLNNTIVVNNGLISADVAGGNIDIDVTSGNAGTGGAGSGVGVDTISALANNGTMQANGGTLAFEGGRYDNTNGVIRAINSGAIDLNNDSRIIGGVLSSDATSTILASGTTQYLQGVTLPTGTRLDLSNDYLYVNAAGLIDNGTITIANASRLNNEGGAAVTYSGSGTIVLDNSVNYAQIYGNGGTITFGPNIVVRGSGQIGLNNTIIVNNNLISSDVAGGNIDIDPVGGNAGTGVAGTGVGVDTISALANNGVMQADGGTMSFEGGRYDNTNGVIRAINGGTVNLNDDSRIIGGSLTSDAASTISASGTTQYLQSVTLTAGTRLNLNNDYLYVNGSLVDDGVITIANASRLNNETTTSVSYSGTGAILLNNAVNYAQIYGNGGALTFGAGLTVHGAGQIGLNASYIVNDGLISADGGAGTSIDLDPTGGNAGNGGAGVGTGGNAGLYNTSIIQVTGGATLNLAGGLYENGPGGIIKAIGGSTIALNDDSRIVNGTLSADATSSISASGTVQYLQGVTLGAGTRLNINNDYLYVNTSLVDNGVITIANGSRLNNETTASVLYSGSGAILLNNTVNYAQIYGNGGALTFASGLTVHGAGQIGLNASYIVNNALISADGGAGTSIVIDPTGGNAGAAGAGVGTGGNAGLYNTSIIQATGGATLSLAGGLYENSASGVIQAINGGTVALANDSRIVGGTLTADATSTISASGAAQYLQGVTLSAGSNLGLNNDFLYVNTGLVDNGVITIANASRLNNETTAAVAYTGTGAILLDSSANYAQIYGNGGQVTFGAALTVHGQGQIGLNNSLIVNNGLISADVAGAAIDIDATGGSGGLAGAGVGTNGNSAMLNSGTLQATTGGTLSFEGGVYENSAAGAMIARTGSTIAFNSDASLFNLGAGGVLSGGVYASITTGAASTIDLRSIAANGIATIGTNGAGATDTVVTLSGANSALEVTPFGGGAAATIDSTLTGVGKTGELQLLNGRSLAIVAGGGAFSNAGLVALDASTLSATSFANSGTLSGNGTIASPIQNTGAITATGGVLNTLAITGASGTVTTTTTGTLSLGGASMIGTLVNNGALVLNGNSITITSDYQNAGFGSANAFNPRAGVTGGGAIDAAGAVLNVSGLNLAAGTLNVGNVRVGGSSSTVLTLSNTGALTVLRGAVQNINAPGVAIANPDFILNPMGGSATATISYLGSTSGSLAGQSLKIVTNFNNVAPQTVSIIGIVTQLASAQVIKAGGAGTLTGAGVAYTVNLGNLNANSGTVVADLGVKNAIANTAYAETLGGSFAGGTTGGYTFAGASFSGVVGGASTTGDDLSFDTAGLTTGVYTDTVTLDPTSHFAGLTDASLAPITIAFTADVIGAPSGCTSNVAGSHVFALAGDVCAAAPGLYNAPTSVATPLPVAFTGFGFFAYNGGAINAPGAVTIDTTGVSGAYGAWSDGAAAQINFSSTINVATLGAGSFGLYATNGGVITAAGTATIATSGAGSTAIYASGAGSAITMAGAAVSTSGNGAIGLRASNGGAISASAGAVTIGTTGAPLTTSGTGAYGVNADGAGSQINLGAATITTAGAGAAGLYASDANASGSGGVINVAGALNVATQGQGAHGAFAQSAGAGIALSGPSALSIGGAGAFGLYAANGGAIAASGPVTIKATGAGDAGVAANAGSVTLSGALTIATTSPTATGVSLTGANASFSATGGGSIQTAGVALEFLNGAGQTATFDNFSIANTSGDLISVDPSSTTINLTGTTATAATLLDVVGGSTATLNASGSTLTGAILTDAASTTSLLLSNHSIWNVTGNSTVTNLTNNASAIVFAPATGGGFKTLTTTNYNGSGGATLTLNAVLNGAGSGSDQLVINGGAATGVTQLRINNVGGAGALTAGSGIALVTTANGGTTAPGAFQLANRLVVGGYEYSLFRSSALPGDQDFYLRSAPAPTNADIAASLTALAQTRQSSLITNRILNSILLGANEQVNCSNCASGFAAVGSFDVGAHGRWSLSDRLTILGGVSVDQYSENGASVASSPSLAASLRYDFVDWGKTRPFFEGGGGISPYQLTTYSRSYANGTGTSTGSGSSIDRSASAFVRVGAVSRITPIDEIAAYADVSRNWDQSGGYNELSGAGNPFLATVGKGVDSVDIAKFGAQYTHLVADNFEVNVNGGVARSFASVVGVGSSVDAFGGVSGSAPGPITWFEYGGRVGYRVSQKMVVDAFLLGTLGPEPAGRTIHGGVGLRFAF
jgi:hypothetical protein